MPCTLLTSRCRKTRPNPVFLHKNSGQRCTMLYIASRLYIASVSKQAQE